MLNFLPAKTKKDQTKTYYEITCGCNGATQMPYSMTVTHADCFLDLSVFQRRGKMSLSTTLVQLGLNHFGRNVQIFAEEKERKMTGFIVRMKKNVLLKVVSISE